MNLNTESKSTLLTVKNIMLAVVSALLVFYFISWYLANASSKEKDALLKTSTADVIFYKDKYGKEVALTEQLKVEIADTYLRLKFKDSLNIELQKLVLDNKIRLKGSGSATIIKTEGSIKKNTSTIVTKGKDKDKGKENEIEFDNFPTYSTKFKDKWTEYSIIADKDSISVDFRYVDKYSLVLGKEKDKSLSLFTRLFSKKVDYAWVTTASPYSKIKETKTLQVTLPPEPKVSFGIQTGYGISKDLNPSPYIGIGISYKLFSLKL